MLILGIQYVFSLNGVFGQTERNGAEQLGVPFYEQPTLGGEHTLRAFGRGRYVGSWAALVNWVFCFPSGSTQREKQHPRGDRRVNSAFYRVWKSGMMAGCTHTDIYGTPTAFPASGPRLR